MMEHTGDRSRMFLWMLLVVLLTNVVVLDYVVGRGPGDAGSGQRLDALEERVRRISTDLSQLPSAPDSTESSVVSRQAVPVPTPAPAAEKETVVREIVTQLPGPEVKEYYIPLGQASVKTENYTWKDTGAEANLNLSSYPGVSQVRFEATLSVQAGHVETRLFNVSDGNPLIDSTLVGQGPDPKLYTSGNVILPSGSKSYRVQMRTSLPYTAQMDNARIRILIE